MTDDQFDPLIGLNIGIEGEGRFTVEDVSQRSSGTWARLREAGTDPTGFPDKTITLASFESRSGRGEIQEVAPDPRDVHRDRSQYARRQDEARDAHITTDPEVYAKQPDRYDFPGVDTGPTFRETQGQFKTDSFIDRIFDF